MLAGELADGVRRKGIEPVVLVDRDRAGIAVDRGGRRVYDPFGIGVPRGHQDVECPADVRGEVVARVGRGGDDVAGGHVEDDRVPFDEVPDERLVGDRALDELGAGRDCVTTAGEQVVQHRDPRPGGDQPPNQCRADEAGAAGHEDSPAAKSAIEHHQCLTPSRSKRAGRKRRHQSRRPRIFVKPLAWYRTVTGCSTTR